MFNSIFHRNPPLTDDLLFFTTRRLEIQSEKLKLATTKLHERENVLLDECKAAILQGRKESATIYANEIAEIRKLLRVISHTELTMEQVILRLQTIKELNPILNDLKTVLNMTQKASKQLTKIMPEISNEMKELSNVVSAMLSTTELSSTPPIPSPMKIDTATKEILQESSEVAEEILKESLPEPPLGITAERTENVEAAKQMVALTAASSEVHEQIENPAEGYITYKGTESREVSLTIRQPSSSSIEEWILDYIQKNKGEVNVMKCAEELNILSKDVLKALEILNAQGKIKLEQ